MDKASSAKDFSVHPCPKINHFNTGIALFFIMCYSPCLPIEHGEHENLSRILIFVFDMSVFVGLEGGHRR
ncbi:hypothetical protein, partial [Limoniibacter endophyticus]